MENTTLVKRTLLVCLHVYITNHTKLTKRKTREDTKTKERPQKKSKSEQEDVDNITSIEQIDLKNAVAQLKVRASHSIDACNKIKEFKDSLTTFNTRERTANYQMLGTAQQQKLKKYQLECHTWFSHV
jgi:hypothetical protein